MESKKKFILTGAFIVLLAAYLIVGLTDGAVLWESIFAGASVLDTWFHSILTLGSMPSVRALQWGSIPEFIGGSFPNIVISVFPVLALVFAKKERKTPAVIFSVINLLLSVLLTICMYERNHVFAAFWAPYAAASVILLVFAMGKIKNAKIPAGILIALGVLSVIATLALSVYRVIWHGAFDYYGMKGIKTYFTINGWEQFVWRQSAVAGAYYPISRAIMYFLLGTGMLCPFDGSIKAHVKERRMKKAESLSGYKAKNTEEDFMFENVGGKIKAVATVMTWIGIAGSVISGIATMVAVSFIMGIVIAVVGSLCSWIGALVLFGFGEMVENSDIRTGFAIQAEREKNARKKDEGV